MSTRERATFIFDSLTEKQLEAFITLFDRTEKRIDDIEEVEPDEWDKKMIAESQTDNDESISFDDLVKKLGVNPNDLRS